MFQENELVNLFSGLIGIVVVATFANRIKIAQLRLFYVGFGLMFCAYIATVAEGVLWPNFLNLVEHLALALAGISIAAGCRVLAKAFEYGEEPVRGR